ncbi:LacI family DNA-binding transcriptional regulator [Arthrobacter agilis]|uniref:LacI family DNA-binding transcriptional regulator n=1 Tax=Arthrobacter agilis TaxID=37921 RepID=UPI002366C68E|nr:LacI family DNA-binding transcriptional regulator [Arthrobacter agilis]WDF32584.1 LacI family DNA-binding transcriptional regulator [Arthrobacter agilis]
MSAPVSKSPATLHDVAREAGVSLATASRSLNGSARKVNESYRLRVVEAAQRLGYTTNLFAQAVAKGSTTTVALIVADIADPYFSSIAAGVIDAAGDENLVVTIAVTGRSSERELDTVRALRGQRPRVMILAGSRTTGSPYEEHLRAELSSFEDTGGKVAFISQDAAPFATVLLDNRGGARDLAIALAGLGYRRVAVITGPAEIRTAEERLDGFRTGLAEHGIPLLPEQIIHADFTREGGYRGTQELLASGAQVDLIFAVNDVMAVGVVSALRDAGLVPGQDIGVAGFDDIPTVRDITPALSTVRIPLEDVGRHALRLATGTATDVAAVQQAVSTETIIRGSTPPRDATAS